MVQAQPMFDPATQRILFGTRNAGGSNGFHAIDVLTGATAWSFTNTVPEGGDGQAMGIVSGPALILGSQVVFTSRTRAGGSAHTVWALDFTAGSATFAPIAAALRVCLRLDDGAGRDAVRAAVAALMGGDESARIADGIAALLAGTPAPPEETFFVVRRLLAALAVTRPVVLAIDDPHWAEPLLLDLTEHLVQWSAGVPLFVLVAARPELRELRSSLATTGALVADVVTLGGLDAAAATRLAANVVGADALPAAIAGRVLATSEGNPLFVGELVRMLHPHAAASTTSGPALDCPRSRSPTSATWTTSGFRRR